MSYWITIFLVLAASSCVQQPRAQTATAGTLSAAKQTEAAGLTTTTFKVEGMTCESCSQAIEGKLAGLDGVSTVAADSKAGKAIVQFDPGKVSEQQLIAAIDSLKFRASKL